MFETIILNIIYLIFPLMLYIIYCMYASVVSKKTSSLIRTFFLITSFYFLIRFGSLELNNLPFILILVPLLIAYVNGNTIGIIILSIVTFIYYVSFKTGMLTFISLLLSYVIYKATFFKNKNIILFIIIILNLFPFVFNISSLDIYTIIYMAFSIIFPLIIVNLINSLINVADLHMNLQTIEHEKQVRLSIFKITHEIKNPIAVCKGYLDMFDVNNIEHSKKYIPIIKSEITRTLILLQDFLDFNKIKLEKEEMDLVMLFDDIQASCIPILNNKKISFKSNIDENDEEIYINGDYNRLKQVLINILKNSIEALENINNPSINILYKIKKDYIHIYIEDNGCGMSREVLARIKEPFFTTKPTGSGLGITISQEVIKGHNGIIKYTSKENFGTKVEIILPLAKEK